MHIITAILNDIVRLGKYLFKNIKILINGYNKVELIPATVW